MQYLVGTESVHTTAAICDYLVGRATAADIVTVVAAVPPGDDIGRRDGQEALNVAPVRLATVGDVETVLRDGAPADVLSEAATEFDADEIVIGTHGGAPDSSAEPGTTARTLLEIADRPVVVVPIPEM